jgi:hypothetical protein
MQRAQAGEALSALDSVRFQLPGPVTADPSDEDWRKALGNAHVQMEHQRIRYAAFVSHHVRTKAYHRHTNLALLQQYGSNAWRVNNYRVEAETKAFEKELDDVKQATTDVNRERKNFQV